MTLEELKTQVSMIYSAQTLESAVGMLQTILNSVGTSPLIQTNINSTVPVIYGKDGYTDADDPRQQNARTHGLVDGKVTAVWLTVHTKPETKYKCVNAMVINEENAKGQTTIFVSVKNKNGTYANDQVIMATGYQGQSDKFDDYLTPGNSFRPVQHILADSHNGSGCTFIPPALGGIAIFVAGSDIKQINSDVVGNLGLPYAHHVSYMLEFVER